MIRDLYEHAEMVSVSAGRRPIALCLSRLGNQDRSTGRGRLLLLHGNPASMQDFRHLSALLRKDFELCAIDLPGFGRSEMLAPEAGQSMLDAYASHVLAAADRIGWSEPFFVMGHSH